MIPGLGPILAAGPVVAWIVAGLEGAVEVGALGALGAGLYSIGIPKDSIVEYETALKTDQFLLIVHGTAAEVGAARDIIKTTHPVKFSQHDGEAIAA
jgi:predicted alpha/beta-hydrolase family hydrolase